MKINLKKFKYIFSVLTVSLALFGCRNGFSEIIQEDDVSENSTESKSVMIQGQIFSPAIGAVPEQMKSRSAVPTITLSNYFYSISASNGIRNSDGIVDSSNMTYSISLYNGDYYILAVDVFADAAKSKKILAGHTTISVVDGIVAGSTDINLSPVYSGVGYVSLPVKVATDTGITKFIAKWEVGGTPKIQTIDLTPGFELYDFQMIADGDGMFNTIAGMYTVNFIFYADEAIAYSFVETINVIPDLTTDKWHNNVGAVYLTGNQIYITKALTDSYKLKTFYVEQTAGDDINNSGGFLTPLKSVQRAVNMIEAVNDGVSEYSIILNGDFTADDSMTFLQGGLNEYNVVCIDPSSDLKLKIKSNKTAQKRKIDAAASASSERRGIYVGVNADVELENLIISNGYVDAKNGGGIFVDGKVTMNNCEISHNTVTGGSNYYGGGIYISTSGILIADTIDVNNNVSSGGAGIQSKGTSTISNSFISSNVCNAWGGGLRINGGKTEAFNTEIYDNSANYGAGIEHVFGEVLLSDCNIHDNKITSADVYAGADIILSADSESKTFTITKNTIVKGIISTRTGATKNYKKLVVQDLTGSADTQIFKINVQNGASGDLVVYGMNGYEDRFKVYSADGSSELSGFSINSEGKYVAPMIFGGSIVHTLVLDNDISFSASTATVTKSTGAAITIGSSINSNPVADVVATYENFKVEVLSYGVRTGVENMPGMANVVIPSGCEWPAGKYELYITGKYQGVEYNASLYFDLTE